MTDEGRSPAQHGEAPAERLADLLTSRVAEEREDRLRLRWFLALAAVLHAGVLLVTVPQFAAVPREVTGRPSKVYLVRQVRFRPPPPKPQRKAPRPPHTKKKIPIPDPTPHDPEPIMRDELPVPEIELPELDGLVFGIPDAPPVGTASGLARPAEVFEVGGEVKAPQKLFGPPPRYSEEARMARVQGTVILRTLIDAEGTVVDAVVLKGLPLGLSESAVETALAWKFKPATLAGKPVPVYFHLTVNFRVL